MQNIITVNSENRRDSNVKKTNMIRFSGEGRPLVLFITGHAKGAVGSQVDKALKASVLRVEESRQR